MLQQMCRAITLMDITIDDGDVAGGIGQTKGLAATARSLNRQYPEPKSAKA